MSTEAWSTDELEQRFTRGPHKSSVEAKEFIREEMAEFHSKSFWVVLPWELVKDIPGMRVSPLGSIPQRDRRPRLINDLTFYGVNDDTIPFAPASSMQFGRALERLLYRIRHANPEHGPVYMNKIDIADGFYRMWLHPSTSAALTCVMPRYDDEPPLVAMPIGLPMGWVESPPSFCGMTETVADLANARMHHRAAPEHRLEQYATTDTPPPPLGAQTPPTTALAAQTPPSPPLEPQIPPGPKPAREPSYACVPSLPHHEVPSMSPLRDPLAYTDIYVDDFCNLVQGNENRRRVVLRIILHTIDEVLRPLDPAMAGIHNEPASVKKLKKGDGTWSTLKVILGWLIDSLAQTIRLPQHRCERLLSILESLDGRKRVTTREWHKVLGELRSMSLAVPGARGLFSALQTGFRQKEAAYRIRIDRNMRTQLDDFKNLALDLHTRPTHLAEIIPDTPSGIGACDASGMGAGGVWLCPDVQPILWRDPFDDHIVKALVSDKNPAGTISNSDLELAGIVGHADVLAQCVDVRNRTFATLNDNVPALVWLEKGSTTTQKAGNQLLRLAGFHQRHHRYLSRYDHISGKANAMADDASRLFHLPDDEFLAHFNSTYPQTLPWRLYPLRKKMHSALTCCLSMKPAALAAVLNVPVGRTTPGKYGSNFVQSSNLTPFWKMSKMRSHTSKSLPNDTEMDASQKAVSPSHLDAWRTPYVPSARRWPAWGPRTDDWMERRVATNIVSTPCSPRGNGSTNLPNVSSPSPSASWSTSSHTPPAPKVTPLGTCPKSVSSSWAAQENLPKQSPPTAFATRSASMTSSSTWTEKCSALRTHRWNPWLPLGPSRWSTPTKRTTCAPKASPMASRATPAYAPSKLSSAASSTSAPTMPHHTPLSTVTTPAPTHSPQNPSRPTTSPAPSAPAQPSCAHSWASIPRPSLPAVSVPEAPLLCSAPVSTPSLPNSLVDGSLTKC